MRPLLSHGRQVEKTGFSIYVVVRKKMAKHIERMTEIGKYVPPREGTLLRKYLDELFASSPIKETLKKKVKKAFKMAHAIVGAQLENGAGFQMDKVLREFLLEYNGRNIQHGLLSLPSSFNIIESFVEYNPECSMFRLYDEKDYLFSFQEFLEYATSPEVIEDIGEILGKMDEGIIYSYNGIADPGSITFTMCDKAEFGIGGVSLIRHGSEVNILLLSGEKADLATESRKLREEKVDYSAGEKGISPAPDLKREAVPLLGNKQFWKSIILSRIDLENNTQNARYVLKDAGNSYSITTDDLSVFLDPETGDLLKPFTADTVKKLMKEIRRYDVIFELCKTALQLPLYFWKFIDEVKYETHPTTFLENRKKGKWLTREKLIGPKESIAHRQVAVLQRNIKYTPDRAQFNAPEFKLETSGYWKNLEFGKTGIDKHGHPIHGRTWVEKRLSWVEEDNEQGVLLAQRKKQEKQENPSSPEINPGYIYVMRSAAHEKDIFKIGMTTRASNIRSDELSRTSGVPDKFLVVEEWEISDCRKAEKLIHNALDKYRINPAREFFKAPYKIIRKNIDEIMTELEKQSGDEAKTSSQ